MISKTIVEVWTSEKSGLGPMTNYHRIEVEGRISNFIDVLECAYSKGVLSIKAGDARHIFPTSTIQFAKTTEVEDDNHGTK